jgi:membrane fusion protein, multidrug efflux system
VIATQDERPPFVQREPTAKASEHRADALRSNVGERAERSSNDPPDGVEEAADRKAPAQRGAKSWIAAHKLLTALIIVVALAATAAGVVWWLNARHFEDTDDAFIDARPSAISAQVAAAIADVPVTDNEIVQSGQVLARLDDRDYRAAQAQAEAQIAQAEAVISSAEAQTTAQQSTINETSLQVTQAEAALTFSKDQNGRAQTLLGQGSGTLQQAQQTNSDLIQKQAALDAAQAALTQARRQLAVLAAQRQVGEAQRNQAEAQLAQANANLSRTVLTAPFPGRVTQLTAAKGAYAAPGQALMLIVPLGVWVTANFRETQLTDMRPGQPADLCVDAYGRCFPGHVDSIQAGSGTAFSLLPAENATGNYVKVVQRVPVKLVFDKQPDLELGPGMSVTPSVRVR